MRTLFYITVLSLAAVTACTPVFESDLMARAARDFDPRHLVETPEVFKDRLFVFGGVIVETKLVEEGSLIEGLFVPVDRYGSLRELSSYRGRFLALYPRSRGILDPLIFKQGREVTLAGDFAGIQKGKIGEMEYSYPSFDIVQVHLWSDPVDYRYPPAYYYSPYYYPYPYGYDPWLRHYPGPPWYGYGPQPWW